MSTKIEWTDDTWNPVRGCARVSPGCDNCYAIEQAHRFSFGETPDSDTPSGESFPGRKAGPYHGLTVVRNGRLDWSGVARFVPEQLSVPLKVKKPTSWFVNSMSDLFHHSITNEQIAAVFGIIAACPQHKFQILTKRAERLPEWFRWYEGSSRSGATPYAALLEALDIVPAFATWHLGAERVKRAAEATPWPLPNLCLMVSCEDQKRADERIPYLLKTPAALRGLSLEPLLGPVDLSKWIAPVSRCSSCGEETEGIVPGNCPHCNTDNLITLWGDEQLERARSGERYSDNGPSDDEDGPQLHWVIVGGESNKKRARRLVVDRVRSVVACCTAASVPVFVKQLGDVVYDNNDVGFDGEEEDSEWPAETLSEDYWKDPRRRYQGAPMRILLRAKKGGDPLEWPKELRVRQYPVYPMEPVA